MELISRQVLELWNRYKPTIAVDAIEYDRELKKLLGTNLAEVGTDCISRKQAIETFKDCAVNGVGIDGIVDALKQLPSAQPEILACGEGELNVPDINVGDMISRQAAIKATWQDTGYTDPFNVMTAIRDRIKQLPPIQPKRGRWVLVCDNNEMHFICNKCGAWRYHQEQKFCGECGADMRGEQNG